MPPNSCRETSRYSRSRKKSRCSALNRDARSGMTSSRSGGCVFSQQELTVSQRDSRIHIDGDRIVGGNVRALTAVVASVRRLKSLRRGRCQKLGRQLIPGIAPLRRDQQGRGPVRDQLPVFCFNLGFRISHGLSHLDQSSGSDQSPL